jgi:hypothetical protein
MPSLMCGGTSGEAEHPSLSRQPIAIGWNIVKGSRAGMTATSVKSSRRLVCTRQTGARQERQCECLSCKVVCGAKGVANWARGPRLCPCLTRPKLNPRMPRRR